MQPVTLGFFQISTFFDMKERFIDEKLGDIQRN